MHPLQVTTPPTCKDKNSINREEAADLGELSVTADPLAGDDDDTFEQATFSIQK